MIPVNQKLAPVGFAEAGVVWQDLGAPVSFAGGTFTVVLTNAANGFIIADSVRLERLSPLQMEFATNDNAPDVASHDAAYLLSAADAQSFVNEAAHRWSTIHPTVGGLLASVQVNVAALPAGILGLASESTQTIWLSPNGAGQGWFVDSTPMWDEEFAVAGGTLTSNRVDLLTVVAHELGHVLGFADLDDDRHDATTMTESLAAGLRRVPTSGLPPSSFTSLISATAGKSPATLANSVHGIGLDRLLTNTRDLGRAADDLFTHLGLDELKKLSQTPIANTANATLRFCKQIAALPLTSNQKSSVRGPRTFSPGEATKEVGKDTNAHEELFAHWGDELAGGEE